MRTLLNCLCLALFLSFSLSAGEFLTDWYWSEAAPPLKISDGELTGVAVKIPHTINALDIQDGGGKDQMSKSGYRRAPAWYAIDLPKIPSGKRIFVRFGAVSMVAEIYLNGEKIGEHRAPATAFAVELTPHLNADGNNRLVVMADNTWRDDVAPLSGDFAIPNGIYRPVELIIKSPICFGVGDKELWRSRRQDESYYWNGGLFFTQKEVIFAERKRPDGTIDKHYPHSAKFWLDMFFNLKKNPAQCKIIVRLLNADGEDAIEPHENEVFHDPDDNVRLLGIGFDVKNPRLWNGIADPYLYTVQAILEADDGSRDEQSLKIGFRDVKITTDGTFLNGKFYPLRGVNRHQDRDNQYWAITPEQEREDVEWLKKIGANTVRAAHYPQSEIFLDACDEAGILVWAELPLIDTVGDNPDALLENLKIQLSEMIAQQRHHASIFCWSLYNEIGHRPGKNKTDAARIINTLNELAKKLDPTRYTAAGANKREREWCETPEIMAYNGYPGWYGGDDGSQTNSMKTWRDLLPNKPMGISEYGAGGSIKHQDDAIKTRPQHNGKWHPEAWQTRVHEAAWASIAADPKIWGTYVWNMFDFASVWRSEGDRDGINDKGLVTYDRKVAKDAFYLYKANWNPEPMVYLLARRDTQRKIADTVIRYYTNQNNAKVTVTLNGEKLDAASAKNYAPKAWIIENIKLQKGKNVITATAITEDGKNLTDEVDWELE